MVLPSGCTMCVGSGVMCRAQRGTLRSGENCSAALWDADPGASIRL